MKIKLSRHAKRRAKLYKIPERELIEILMKRKFNQQGKINVIEQIHGIKYPVKIVISLEGDLITVIKNYPLKKAIKK